MISASARRLFQSAKLTCAISDGTGLTPADEERAEAAAAGEVLLDDLGDALRKDALAGEGKHRDRDLVGAAADNLDGELGAGRSRQNKECRGQRS